MHPGRKQTVAQLQQALREKSREVDALHRISESISNTLDLEAVLKHIVDMVVEVTKADACLLYLLSDGRDELILRASKNPHPKLIGRITIGLGEGITGWVARERTRVIIPSNASDDPRFQILSSPAGRSVSGLHFSADHGETGSRGCHQRATQAGEAISK